MGRDVDQVGVHDRVGLGEEGPVSGVRPGRPEEVLVRPQRAQQGGLGGGLESRVPLLAGPAAAVLQVRPQARHPGAQAQAGGRGRQGRRQAGRPRHHPARATPPLWEEEGRGRAAAGGARSPGLQAGHVRGGQVRVQPGVGRVGRGGGGGPGGLVGGGGEGGRRRGGGRCRRRCRRVWRRRLGLLRRLGLALLVPPPPTTLLFAHGRGEGPKQQAGRDAALGGRAGGVVVVVAVRVRMQRRRRCRIAGPARGRGQRPGALTPPQQGGEAGHA